MSLVSVSIKVLGIQEALNRLRKAQRTLEANAQRGLREGANYLRNESLDLVPIQMGPLRASCHAPVNVGGKGFKADYVVSYGRGAAGAYAVYVHEDLVAQAPPARAAHGKFFNIKHAAEIAKAGHLTPKGRWKADTYAGTARGGMFPRGEKQQAKYLETPFRQKRKEILRIIYNAARGR